tara:strand:+ start:228 stop:896 length:669 start_codon:yes stop_codon:yes gene_type:complete
MNFTVSEEVQGLIGSDWASGILSSLAGAIIGAILGSYGTYKTTTSIQDHNVNKIREAYYSEIEHVSDYLISYLEGVARDHCKFIIKTDKNDTYCGPIDIDFSVLKALEIELIKNKVTLTKEQRKVSHNIPVIVNSIFGYDEQRIAKVDDYTYRSQYKISVYIMERLILLISSLNRYTSLKENYQTEPSNGELTVYKIKQVLNLTRLSSEDKCKTIEDLSKVI